MAHALEAGAMGYLLKGTNAQDLIMAVKGVKAGGPFISPNPALPLPSNNAQTAMTASSP